MLKLTSVACASALATIAGLTLGCSSGQVFVKGSATPNGGNDVEMIGETRGHPLPQATQVPKGPCELSFRVITFDNVVSSDWVCIKSVRGPIEIPQSFDLLTKANWTANASLYCDPSSPKAEDGTTTCRWNRVFRDTYPFSFEFIAPNGIATAIAAVRVYRNGRLQYAWKKGDPLSDVAGNQLVVSGSALRQGYPANLSDLSLYVTPAGVTVDDSAVAAIAVQHASSWRDRLTAGFRRAVNDPSSALAKFHLEDKFECFQKRIEYISSKIVAIQSAKTANDDQDWFKQHPSCTAPSQLAATQAHELKTLLDQAASHRIDGATLHAKLGAFSAQLSGGAKLDIDAALDEITNAIKSGAGPGAQEALNAISAMNEIAATARGQAEDTVQFIQDIKGGAMKDLSTPESQMAIYKSFAAGIGDEKDLFEDRQANPPPALGDGALNMKYADKLQHFYIAAWTGLPLPILSSSQVKTELHAENLIPIIDLVGWRWQFGTSALTDFKFAFGIIGVRETVTVNTPTGSSDHLTNFNLGPQLNFGLAALKIGVAYIVREDKDSATSFADAKNFRVMVGADILKLISGKDAQLVTKQDSQASSSGSN